MLALALVTLGVLFRVLPHPDNFTPTMAIALFSGAVLAPSLAFSIPLLLMMASDLAIGLHPLFWLVWGSFLAVTLLGTWLKQRLGAGRMALATLSGSLFFFVTTNLGVFFFTAMYPKTWEGLLQCFAMAVPFFRNSLAGDVLYTFSFFAVYLAAQRVYHPKKAY
jgi:hypothetical protein